MDAPQQALGSESRSASLDGAEDNRLAPAITESAGSGMMISPFANGPGVPSRHHRRLSDPGSTAKGDMFRGTCSSHCCFATFMSAINVEMQHALHIPHADHLCVLLSSLMFDHLGSNNHAASGGGQIELAPQPSCKLLIVANIGLKHSQHCMNFSAACFVKQGRMPVEALGNSKYSLHQGISPDCQAQDWLI